MSKYLETFSFMTPQEEGDYIFNRLNSIPPDMDFSLAPSGYPFRALSSRGLVSLDFEPITILYGDNGCGKSTAINIMSSRLGAKRETVGNTTALFDQYVSQCDYSMPVRPETVSSISSDSIFDKILDTRKENLLIREKRNDSLEQYNEDRRQSRGFQLRSLDDFEKLKRINEARSVSSFEHMRRSLLDPIDTYSNGETALYLFTNEIKDNGLYLLDEPENSLSPRNQIQLADFIFNQARFFHCQFVIATHSPFLLAIPEAKIYEIGDKETKVKKWTELDGVKTYFDFFMSHKDEFDKTTHKEKGKQ
jgi:predicted ATPase